VVEELDDLGDPRLADYLHLREPSRRMGVERERGIFTLEGRLSLEALLASPYEVRSILVTRELAARVDALVAASRRANDRIPILSLSAEEIEALSGVHFHRGVLAVAVRPSPRAVGDVVAGARRVLVLESVNDHENVGALFRNAAAFGVDAVVLDPTTSDPLYRRATRVSLGHVLHVPFARVEAGRWPAAVEELRDSGLTTVALTPDRGAEPLGALVADAPRRVALLLGAEGPGLTPGALAAADRRVRIPMVRDVDSVNVATAAAIALSALHGWT
jgi:tRNA G18 (ribose-2'-O)-methylase SpoU